MTQKNNSTVHDYFENQLFSIFFLIKIKKEKGTTVHQKLKLCHKNYQDNQDSICILEIKQNKSTFNTLANLLPMIWGKLVITNYYFKATSLPINM